MEYGPKSKVLVVGAGCFGLSTAYHLLKRGYKNVTVIDRSEVLPAPDAASTDLNKIVRSSYADIFYTNLAREAIENWKDEGEWGVDTYHECGVLVLGSESHAYSSKSYENDLSIGCRVQKLDDPAAITSLFPSGVSLGSSVARNYSLSFINRDGGWVHSAGGIIRGMSNVKALGGKIIPGKQVRNLTREGGKTSGVECTDGSVFEADLVVIATGSWTSSVFADLNLEEKCTATGQSIAMIQLTSEEATKYRQVPVILDQETGFYVFPPNSDNIIKLAIHGRGYAHRSVSSSNISTPRTTLTHGAEQGSRIPKTKVRELRDYLRGYYPQLADTKPFIKTRLCWYSDTPDEDWMIGFHPADKSVVFATGGSGHAYKFFPVIGRLVADLIQGTLSADLISKFSIDRLSDVTTTMLERRRDDIPELDEDQLCEPDDLLP